jgi:hypothetical protein
MDEWHTLNIRLQMEILITEREGMIAENQCREHLGQTTAYTMDNFQILNEQFTKLWEYLKNG